RKMARQPVEVAPLDQLKHQVGLPILFADLVDLHDPVVPQPGDDLGLRTESPRLVGAWGAPGAQQLERHEPFETWVTGLVDHGHAASAQRAEDLVAGQHLGWFGLVSRLAGRARHPGASYALGRCVTDRTQVEALGLTQSGD